MEFQKPITDLIERRYSCRTYQKEPLAVETQDKLTDALSSLQIGPLGSRTRFELVAATQGDSTTLRGLGTYGFIKNAPGFIVGALLEGEKDLEDFGYQMEQAILFATHLGLGSCWLGGTFTRSSFARKIGATEDEAIPAVTAVGYIAETPRWIDGEIRQRARADHRKPWDRLFFDSRWENPLSQENAGAYAVPLEMVRLGPSASNRQPWRILRDGKCWHFYLRRTVGYRHSNAARLLKFVDLQRIDMGIAMCHFELTARELGLAGHWIIEEPDLHIPAESTEYTVTWRANEPNNNL